MNSYYSLDPDLSTHPVSRWEEIMSEVYYKLDIKSDRRKDLTGSIEEYDVDGLSITKFSSDQQRVLRSPSKIAIDPDDSYVLVFPLSDDLYFEQLGRNGFIQPGGYVMVRTSEFYELACPDGFTNVTLKVPAARVDERYHHAEDHCSRKFPNNVSLSRVLRSFLVSLSEVDEDSLSRHGGRFADETLNLVQLLLEAERSGEEYQSSRSRRCLNQQVVHHMRSNLEDPDLNPAVTAASVGISRSYMDRLLHDAGTSYQRKLRELRLQNCYEKLADAACRHLSISEIAYTSGFSNISHFTKSFKEMYSLTPRQIRQELVPRSVKRAERL